MHSWLYCCITVLLSTVRLSFCLVDQGRPNPPYHHKAPLFPQLLAPPETDPKTEWFSRGVPRRIFWRLEAVLSDVGSNIGPELSQNGPKVAVKRESDMVFDSEPFFYQIFNDFSIVFNMIFRWCFWSAHDVNNKVHCSESSHFYNRF